MQDQPRFINVHKHSSNPYDGTLIAVEGIDCSGKSTIIDEVKYQLWEQMEEHGEGYDVLFSKEPTFDFPHSVLSDDESSPLRQFFAFCGDRVGHIANTLEEPLSDGTTCIVDRYVDSTRAYQTRGVADQLNISTPTARGWMEDVMKPWTIEPDYVVYVDVPVSVASERLSDRSRHPDSLEGVESIRDAKRSYEVMYDGDSTVLRLDGRADPKKNAELFLKFLDRVDSNVEWWGKPHSEW